MRSYKKALRFLKLLFLMCILLMMLNMYLFLDGDVGGGGRNLGASHKWRMSEIDDLKLPPDASSRQTSVRTEISSSANDVILNLCPPTPPHLVGALVVNMEPVSFDEIKSRHPDIKPGGRFQPLNCKSRHRVAIIVPYRNREQHLQVLLNHLHPILERQQLDYAIYVVEMTFPTPFNRALLMNIGYAEALKDYDFQCFVFHDVDLIVENDNNMYTCGETPRHLVSGVDKHNYKMPYPTQFGGAVSLTKQHMEKVNGFSNVYFGWGSEDDDMRIRLQHKGLRAIRSSPEVGRYRMIKHDRDKYNEDNTNRGKYVRSAGTRMMKDGLNSLKYELLKKEYKPLYTHVYVRVTEEDLMV